MTKQTSRSALSADTVHSTAQMMAAIGIYPQTGDAKKVTTGTVRVVTPLSVAVQTGERKELIA